MSTCVHTPRKPELYVAMADTFSTFTASGYTRPVVLWKKKNMRNKFNDV